MKTRLTILTVGMVLSATCASAFDAWTGDFSKDNPAYVRVMSYNVYNLFPAGTPEQSAAHTRLLQAIRPDVISYQEMDPGIASALKTRLEEILGGTWYTHEGRTDGVNVNVVASRWPQTLKRTDTVPASSFRGTTIALIDLPNDSYSVDLYLMGVHFACCSGADRDAERQKHADAIAAWIGDARTTGGNVDLAPGTPMLVVGDQNFNAGADPGARNTLLTGSISDTATFGPAIKGDWDDTDISEALPLNLFTMKEQTFNSTTADATSRLDRLFYTDSVATVAQGAVVNTLSIPAAQLVALGLEANDTAIASDHLPVFVDFALPGTAIEEPGYGAVYTTEFQPDPTFVPDVDGEWFEIYNPGSEPIDLNGWVLKDAGTNLHPISGDNAVVAPRSHFVFGLKDDIAINGNVPVDYVVDNFRVANSADAIEIYRGSIKIDGIRYNGGAEGLAPENRDAGSVGPAIARAMLGSYANGYTDTWGAAEKLYNAKDKGTPGQFNEDSRSQESWILY